MPFTTMDRDNDDFFLNCANIFNSGWWFKSCHTANLNGLSNVQSHNGITWKNSEGKHHPMKFARMMIRQP